MNDSDFEKRKVTRRQNIEKKFVDKKSDQYQNKDLNKIKKEFKKAKEEIRQDELWDYWEDEIS
jgi:hypothetical protein